MIDIIAGLAVFVKMLSEKILRWRSHPFSALRDGTGTALFSDPLLTKGR